MRNLILTTLSLFVYIHAYPQNIGGIVNNYTAVSAFDPCTNKLTVTDASSFNVGDYVLMIQMKGAEINTTNTPSFGSIINYHGAGNYEFNFIAAKSGNILTLQNNTVNTYDIPAGVVQLVKVPIYTNATVTAPLTCPLWNGITGGVVVIKVDNNLTLSAAIDVSGKGLRGGSLCSNPDGGCAASDNTLYSYVITSGMGAEKGEGITVVNPAMNGGRGAWANGGGGGNKHNSGGGGGGNFTMGGRGGNQANFCPDVPIGGDGGRELDYTQQKIFAGGGGGCSDYNNAVGTVGTSGGGIIIIEAANITGNGTSVLSNGPDVGLIINGIGDGAGGAGAGGTIIIACGNYTGTTIISANGGHGGDQNTTYPSCFGPGGGGGAGAVLLSAASLPTGVTVSTNAGLSGTVLNPAGCSSVQYGATNGIIGNGLLFNKNLVKSSVAFVPGQNIKTVFQKCSGTDITLNVRAGISYSWSPSSFLSATNIQQPVCSATSNITYLVNVNTGSCAFVDTVEVNITAGVTPTFNSIPALCMGSTPPVLNTSSTNTTPVTGTWSPAAINTSVAGTTTYTFTPTAPQCANTVTMNIVVTAPVTPTFAAVPTLCMGATPPVLSTSSTNATLVTGTWSPTTISTAVAGTSTYTFTPTAGQCANIATINVTITAPVTPTFAAIPALCTGETPPALNTSSSNATPVTGTWSPSAISTTTAGTTSYTFTPTAGQCATSVTISVTITQAATPAFAAISPLCVGDIPPALSTTSSNPTPITGTWSPPAISAVAAGTSTYTFTPTAGQCANTATINVTITASITPTFDQVQDMCVGATAPVLPTSSLDATPVTGSWVPSVINTSAEGTTAYNFTPDPGQCAAPVIMNISIGKKTANLFIPIDTLICPNTSVVLNPGNYLTYLWSDNSILPTLEVSNTGAYWVMVTANNGCTYTDTIKIMTISCEDIFFPSSFTPDGNITNDSYGPAGKLDKVSEFRMLIYDRYGNLLFSTTSPYKKWDGKFNGKDQKIGNYVCFATYIFGNGIKRSVKLNVLLIR